MDLLWPLASSLQEGKFSFPSEPLGDSPGPFVAWIVKFGWELRDARVAATWNLNSSNSVLRY